MNPSVKASRHSFGGLRHGQGARTVRGVACRAGASGGPPYKVLITGSTKGVGRALAEEFLRAGDSVFITSRSDERVQSTVAELGATYGQDRVKGCACNVGRGPDVVKLGETAVREMGAVNIWINNAGTNAYKYCRLTESSDEDLASIVETNMLGVLLCSREAIRVMSQQSVPGHLFNMDGAGADGSATPRFAAYGATKRSLEQLGKSLRAELASIGVSNVGVHDLSPGMVTTELLMSGADTKVSKFFINCLAEPPETVASFLVPRVRDVVAAAQAKPSPAYIRYLTKPKAYSQILQRLVLGARKDRFVAEA